MKTFLICLGLLLALAVATLVLISILGSDSNDKMTQIFNEENNKNHGKN